MFSQDKKMFFLKKNANILFAIFLCISLLGGAVMLLWNSVVAPVLDISKISYIQSIGLLVLCRILFGSFRRMSGKPAFFSDKKTPCWKEKLMNMNDEERAKFREEWKKRCGK